MSVSIAARRAAFGAFLCLLPLAACTTLERPFSGPVAEFRGGGQPLIHPDMPRPDAEKFALGEVDIRIKSGLLSGEHLTALRKSIGEAVGGEWKPWTTKSKQPELRVLVTQVESEAYWKGSEMGALLGASGGAVVGFHAADDPWYGSVCGGGIGGILGYSIFGENQNLWSFHIVVLQATQGVEKARSTSTDYAIAQHFPGQDTSAQTAQGSNTSEVVKYLGDYISGGYACQVKVNAGSFSGRKSIEDAGRSLLIDRLPEEIFGGRSLASW